MSRKRSQRGSFDKARMLAWLGVANNGNIVDTIGPDQLGTVMDSLIKVFNDCPLSRPIALTIIGIFRNEANALCEWLEHYLSLGAEHICLIDNNSTDNFRVLLEPYRYLKKVSLFTCRNNAYQVGAYMELLPKLKEWSEWIGVFDLDEFIYPPNGSDLIGVLRGFDDAAAVLVPWLSFGSNGHVEQPASIIQGFTRRGDAGCSRAFLKSFSRPKCVELLTQHNPTLSRGLKRLANGEVFGDEWHINLRESDVSRFRVLNNHYRLQSRSHFMTVKSVRPEVNEHAQDRIKAPSFFYQYDELWSQIEDLRLAHSSRHSLARLHHRRINSTSYE